MRRPIAYAQNLLEGARWLAREAPVGGTFAGQLQHGHLGEAALLAARAAAQTLPPFDVREFTTKHLLADGLQPLGMGAEVIVLKEDDLVRKYVTGKTQAPEKLASRLKGLHVPVKAHLGEMMPPTYIDVARTKLFKVLPAITYARLTQPYVTVEYMDPHLDRVLLAERPEIAEATEDLTQRLFDLYVDEGLLMDVVNRGNIAWGHIQDGEPNRLLIMDTVPVDTTRKDFTGIRLPFWNHEMYIEAWGDIDTTLRQLKSQA